MSPRNGFVHPKESLSLQMCILPGAVATHAVLAPLGLDFLRLSVVAALLVNWHSSWAWKPPSRTALTLLGRRALAARLKSVSGL